MNSLRRLFVSNQTYLRKFYFCESKRTLFTPMSLGIDLFIFSRQAISNSIQNIGQFKERMKNLTSNDSKSLIFLTDLRYMTAVTETQEDFEILSLLLKKYSSQNNTVVFQNVKIGSELMRLLYWMNKPEYAITLIEDKTFTEHLTTFTSFMIFLDLLFKNEMYEEVVKYYDLLQSKFRNNPNCFNIVYLAACCKLNTEETFQKAGVAYDKISNNADGLKLRGSLLYATLAIRQNKLGRAVEILNRISNNPLAKNLSLIALAKGKRCEDVIYLLMSCFDDNLNKTFFILEETIKCMEEELNDSDEFLVALKQIKTKFCDSIRQETIDNFLYSEIMWKKPEVKQKKIQSHSQKSKRSLSFNR